MADFSLPAISNSILRDDGDRGDEEGTLDPFVALASGGGRRILRKQLPCAASTAPALRRVNVTHSLE